MAIDIHSSLEEIERLNLEAYNGEGVVERAQEADVKDPVDDLEKFAGLLSGKKILDIGCGWGRYVFRFLDYGLDYTGVDFAPRMIEAAQAANPDLSQKFKVMSFRNLEFLEDSFDGCWACCTLNHEPKRNIEIVLQGIRRILKPNGVFYNIMPMAYAGESEDIDFGWVSQKPLFYSSHQPDEFAKHLSAAGFRQVESFDRFESGSMTSFGIK